MGVVVGAILANGVRLHFTESGQGSDTVVFSHSFLLSSEHFRPQIEVLSRSFRCLAFDHRGHGGSEAPNSGYEMENLYADTVGFIEAADCAPCHFVGLSTGGFIGLRLGIRRPDLVRSLVLMDTSADAEPAGRAREYKLMLWMLRYLGYWSLRRRIASTFFSPHFRNDASRRSELVHWRRRVTANDRHAMLRFGRGILERADVSDQLERIGVPTLVVVGEDDIPTPVREAERIARGIPGASLEIIRRAGHICTVERPEAVNEVLVRFLEGLNNSSAQPSPATH
jgi:3-oxoadipate enol-lactonase